MIEKGKRRNRERKGKTIEEGKDGKGMEGKKFGEIKERGERRH